MNNRIVWLVLVLYWTTAVVSSGQENKNRFQIDSKAVQCMYEIEVMVPQGTPPEGKFPTVYCMDWFMLGDYLKSLPGLMALGPLAEPYILVGITQGQSTDSWAVMRTRDYTPAYPEDEFSKSYIYPSALKMTGGADKFTIFLKDELIPRIESRYPSDPSRRCFVGYSLGGLLGVYLLTTNPQLFHYYLLGSPSLWYNEYYLASDLEKMAADSLRMVKKVYLSTGEEEPWEMLKGFDLLRTGLQEKGFEGLKMKAEVIKGSGHVGAMPIALYNGFRYLFPNH